MNKGDNFIQMNLQQVKTYLREVKKLKKEEPQNFQIIELVKFFPAWQRSLNAQASPLSDEEIWITFAARQFMETILQKHMLVWEYGSGGSTLYFAKRVKEVISIEHDRAWCHKVIETMKSSNYKNSQLHLVEPTPEEGLLGQNPSEPNAYISGSDVYKGQSFKNYATKIDEYPDGYFDVVLIDGRARSSCFKHAVKKVKPGGFLILDNAERPYYYYVHESLNNADWVKYSFYGPGPYVAYFWQTCVWNKLEE